MKILTIIGQQFAILTGLTKTLINGIVNFVHKILLPKWRNWQTQWTQNPIRLFLKHTPEALVNQGFNQINKV